MRLNPKQNIDKGGKQQVTVKSIYANIPVQTGIVDFIFAHSHDAHLISIAIMHFCGEYDVIWSSNSDEKLPNILPTCR